MKRIGLFLLVLMVIVIGCKSSKEIIAPSQTKAFNDLVNSREFTIESQWAYPQLTNAMSQVLSSQLLAAGNSASAINLIGNPNFLTIKGDSVTSYLPYYGERQMQIAYDGRDGAIQFNGVMDEYRIEEGKSNSKIISFKAKSNLENFNVTITLFPNYNSEIVLRSTSRFFIRYTGGVEPISSEDEQS